MTTVLDMPAPPYQRKVLAEPLTHERLKESALSRITDLTVKVTPSKPLSARERQYVQPARWKSAEFMLYYCGTAVGIAAILIVPMRLSRGVSLA